MTQELTAEKFERLYLRRDVPGDVPPEAREEAEREHGAYRLARGRCHGFELFFGEHQYESIDYSCYLGMSSRAPGMLIIRASWCLVALEGERLEALRPAFRLRHLAALYENRPSPDGCLIRKITVEDA